MKNFLVVLVAVFFCLPGFSGNDWMDAGNGKIDCKRINLRTHKANIVLEDGAKIGIDLKDISSFSQNGKIYEKLRLYKLNKPTNQMAFMQLIGTWNNLRLVKLNVRNVDTGLTEGAVYYLYNGTKFHLELDDRTLQNTCNTFGIKYAAL